MSTPEKESNAEQALRLAQLEIKMLRQQLALALEKLPDLAPPPSPAQQLPSAPVGAIATEAQTPTESQPGGRQVLCVEDSQANFQLIESILSDRPGTNLRWAENGKKGVEMATAQPPGLVLLDLDLPDMHGSEVLGRLRAEPATAETPVIVISADATPSQIERMLAAGARDYITKPFEIRRFLLMFDEIFPQAAA